MSPDPAPRSWEEVAIDPDPVTDLGYEALELDIITTATNSEQVIVLPKDESLLKDDAFIVVRAADVYDLSDWT